jgi:hypothetical protein
MKKWLKRIGIGALIVVLVVCAITFVRFTRWRNEVTQNLERDSLVVQTTKGPAEYAEIGHGPPVLITHGDPGALCPTSLHRVVWLVVEEISSRAPGSFERNETQ